MRNCDGFFVVGVTEGRMVDRQERRHVLFGSRTRKARAIARALMHVGESNMREAVGYVVAQGWFATVEQARLFVKEHRDEIKMAAEMYEQYPEWAFRHAQEDAESG